MSGSKGRGRPGHLWDDSKDASHLTDFLLGKVSGECLRSKTFEMIRKGKKGVDGESKFLKRY